LNSPFEVLLEAGPLPSPGGPVRRRLAVRAVVEREGRILMVHSGAVGDWKFPGGGVEAGEGPEAALGREIREETGYTPAAGFTYLGRAVERAVGRDGPEWLFEMESRYFLARVTGPRGDQRLDPYEAHLGFTPGWIALEAALAVNRRLAASGRSTLPTWLDREIRVLEELVRRQG